jgi:hypothetical protein
VFKIIGVVHHRITTLLPQQGTRPKFAQLYIHDTENEIYNRLNLFENDDNGHVHPDPDVALSLMNMLNENNQLVKAFRCARERIEQEPGRSRFVCLGATQEMAFSTIYHQVKRSQL